MPLPKGTSQHTLQGIMENDPCFQANLRALYQRASQHKITPTEVRRLHRSVVHLVLYKHCRKAHLPLAVLPRLESMVCG